MTTIEKVKQYISGLENALADLSILSQNLEVKQNDIIRIENTLTQREKSIVERESKVLTQTHVIEEVKRSYEKNKIDLEVKQGKIQSEWDKILDGKNKLESDKEEIMREKLRLANKEKEYDRIIK